MAHIVFKKSPRRSLFSKRVWCLVDCLSGHSFRLDRFPYEIGASDRASLQARGARTNHCAFEKIGGAQLALVKRDNLASILLNGVEAGPATRLEKDREYSLKLGPHYYVLFSSRHLPEWLAQVNAAQWFIRDATTQAIEGPFPGTELPAVLARSPRNPQNTILTPRGIQTGFPLAIFGEALDLFRYKAAPAAPIPLVGVAPPVKPRPRSTALTCPICWLRFDKGDALHIATHETLRGDPILGEDAPLRFLATRFDDEGRALDPLGLPCLDVACPSCRRKLPAGFLDSPHQIFSIVGAPGAGKSYYLSVLAHVLPRTLYQQFAIVFKDADPTGNAPLNALKNRLFSGATPEQVYLEKTALEGAMYERLQRQGRLVALPKPFVFAVAPERAPSRRSCVVFYDNAGEHFEPGIDDVNSPGAQHVATAAAILFLFDPTMNREFRKRLVNHPDPQLHLAEQIDQQHVILTEMETRIKRLLSLPADRRVRTPLAVLVGKCDVWLPLMVDSPPVPVIRPEGFDIGAVTHNSRRLRALLKELCPEIVANAESLSEEVVYFPVSSLGHSPVRLPDGRIAPDPQRLQPQFVEVPILWALTKTVPGLLPVVSP